jgi:beta-glucanase (GH16 family)
MIKLKLSISKYLTVLFLLSFLLIQCKRGCTDLNAVNYDSSAKKDDGSCYSITLPSNLNFTIDYDTTTGLVDIEATAINENFFTVIFFDLLDSTIVQTVNGNASYTYSDTGFFKIKVRAHTSDNDYVEKVDSVHVVFEAPIFNAGYTTPLSYSGYTLVWNDEFNGTSLSSDWIQESGNGSSGWGNNESQYYRAENTSVSDGFLTITAKQENFSGFDFEYTSSRIKTQGVQNFKYGRIDIRAKLPYTQGLWPALWMLGENITSVSWPACGEIDIMELIGGDGYNDATVHGTAHWYDPSICSNQNPLCHALYGQANSLSSGIYNDEFHVFSIIWTSSSIKWLRDDIQYNEMNISNLSAFHNNFFFIFNVAVGGDWPGYPDVSTVLPQTMVVDYVRVFQ